MSGDALIGGSSIQHRDQTVEHTVRGRRAPAVGLAELLGMQRRRLHQWVARPQCQLLPARWKRLPALAPAIGGKRGTASAAMNSVSTAFWSAPGSAVLTIHRGGSDRPPQLLATTGRFAPTAADLPPETGWGAATISGSDQQLNDTAAKNGADDVWARRA